MNTVFKSFKYTQVILAFIFVFILPFKVSAQQCSTIKFISTTKNNESYVAMITQHNGEVIEKVDNKWDIYNEEHEYYLEEGQHSLIVEQWPTDVFRFLRKNNKISKKHTPVDTQFQTFLINLKAGYYYELEFLSQTQNRPKVVVRRVNKKACKAETDWLSEDLILPAKKAVTIEHEPIAFPEALEYRLRKLMTKINTYHKDLSDDSYNNFITSNIDQFFGASFDNEYVNGGSAIQILSVRPFSLASQLNFKSGDKITHFNGIKIKRYNEDRKYRGRELPTSMQLNLYTRTLHIDDEFKATVIRNAEKVEISGKFAPKILPEVNYQILSSGNNDNKKTLINALALPSELHFEFEELIMEIKTFYQKRGYNESHIQITRDEKLDNVFGFSGKGVLEQGEIGLKIENIIPDSLAQQFNLRVGDIIIAINGTNTTSSNLKNLLNSISKHTAGTSLNLTVKRENRQFTIDQVYQPEKLVGFDLAIDLHSIEVIRTALNQIKRRTKRDHLTFPNHNRHYRPVGNSGTRSPYPLKGPVAPRNGSN